MMISTITGFAFCKTLVSRTFSFHVNHTFIHNVTSDNSQCMMCFESLMSSMWMRWPIHRRKEWQMMFCTNLILRRTSVEGAVSFQVNPQYLPQGSTRDRIRRHYVLFMQLNVNVISFMSSSRYDKVKRKGPLHYIPLFKLLNIVDCA